MQKRSPIDDELLLDKVSKLGYFNYRQEMIARWEKKLLERLFSAAKGKIALLARRLKMDRCNMHRVLKRVGII